MDRRRYDNEYETELREYEKMIDTAEKIAEIIDNPIKIEHPKERDRGDILW